MTSTSDHNRGAIRPQIELDFLAREECGDTVDNSGPVIRVSGRARRLSIRVFPDARVEVVAPPRARPHDVQAFLQAHRDWIEAKRAHALRNRPVPVPFPPAEIALACTGEHWRLHVAGGAGPARLTERGDATGPSLTVKGAADSGAVRKALRAWLLRSALPRLTPRVAALSAATGIPYSRISIRRQRSRWGSCSARGTISLNACLLFQRPEVVDYLIVHELSHVRHMNHSARFWQAVERNCQDWRALDRELVQGWRNVPRWVFSDT
jgi:predicted metal-dependent hydrolase